MWSILASSVSLWSSKYSILRGIFALILLAYPSLGDFFCLITPYTGIRGFDAFRDRSGNVTVILGSGPVATYVSLMYSNPPTDGLFEAVHISPAQCFSLRKLINSGSGQLTSLPPSIFFVALVSSRFRFVDFFCRFLGCVSNAAVHFFSWSAFVLAGTTSLLCGYCFLIIFPSTSFFHT